MSATIDVSNMAANAGHVEGPVGAESAPFCESHPCWYVLGNRIHVAAAAKYIALVQVKQHMLQYRDRK